MADTFLSSYRARNPQYANLTDYELTDTLYKRYESDYGPTDFNTFASTVGLDTQSIPLELPSEQAANVQTPPETPAQPIQETQPQPITTQAAPSQNITMEPIQSQGGSMLDMVSYHLQNLGGRAPSTSATAGELFAPAAGTEVPRQLEQGLTPPPPESSWGETLAGAGKAMVYDIGEAAGGGLQMAGEGKEQRRADILDALATRANPDSSWWSRTQAGGRLADAVLQGEITPQIADMIKAEDYTGAMKILANPANDVKPTGVFEKGQAKVAEALTTTGKSIADYFNEAANQARPQVNRGTPKYYTAQAIEGVGSTMIPAVAATMLTKGRNIPAGLATMFAQVAGSSYSQNRRSGLNPDQSFNKAIFDAVTEAGTEAIPLGVLTREGGKYIYRVLKGAAAEGAQEMVSEALQMGYEWGILDKDMSPGQAAQRLLDAGIIGSVGGAGMAAVSPANIRTKAATREGMPTAKPVTAEDITTVAGIGDEQAPAAPIEVPRETGAAEPAQAATPEPTTDPKLMQLYTKEVASKVKGGRDVDIRVAIEANKYASKLPANDREILKGMVRSYMQEQQKAPGTVFDSIKSSLEQAGRPTEEADAGAAIWGAFYDTLGKRTGMKPMELFKNHNITIQAAEKMPSAAGKTLDNVRGAITFPTEFADGAVISLFKKADASTFMHESSHFYLEAYQQISNTQKAPVQIKEDMLVVRDWLGAKKGQALTNSQHEKFASGFEQYLMEGKAPTPALKSVFERFKGWLTDIYKRITTLNIDVNDDIRGVFDRMLTTEPGNGMGLKTPEVAAMKAVPAEEAAKAPSAPEKIVKPETSAMAAGMGMDMPMPNWYPTYGERVPARPAENTFNLRGKDVAIPELDKPQRREGISVLVKDIIGPRLYRGKIKGKSRLGFYKRANGEVRTANYDDVEVMAHEMAHYLDLHSKFADRFSKEYHKPEFAGEVKNLSYTSQKDKVYTEGFAEFTRLWLTNYNEAKARAPKFTQKFEEVLAQDKPLARKMYRLQEDMHKWYLQGPHAQLRAKSGEELSPKERFIEFAATRPLEMARQKTIDSIHGAKVVERVLTGNLAEGAQSPYRLMQLVNGSESLHEAVVKYGTPELNPDGSFSYNGIGLEEVFRPVTKQGDKAFDLLMDYFKARRGQELKKQGRERLFTDQEIEAGLALEKSHPEFKDVFDEYQAFNGRMLNFYEQMGLITKEQRQAFQEANQNYVPFQRVFERIEDGYKGTLKIGKRLRGGTQNVRDIATNIVESLQANIHDAMLARAKNAMYKQIATSEDGAMFAAKIGPDSRMVKAEITQMADKVANAMASLGLTVAKDGMVVAGDINADQVTSIDDIRQALEKNPELLSFWTHGHKPVTLETYVDSAIIDGKRTWFEVKDPLLVDMLTGMGGFRVENPMLEAAMIVKNIQTRTVTSAFQFLGPNAVRDTLSAAVLSKNDFIPIWDTLIGMGHHMFRTRLYKDFMLQGGGYGTRIEARTEERRSRRMLDVPSKDWSMRFAKALAGWDRFASAFEYGSRIGDYAKGIKRVGKVQAVWEDRELTTDFSKKGNDPVTQAIVRTVPFMNAGIQGLDKTAREIFEIKGEMKGTNLVKFNTKKAEFILKGSAITAFTFLLWTINKDDERYKDLTDDQKARYWWIFPKEGKPYKIPKPYDIGHIFATIPEATMQYWYDKKGKDAANLISWAFVNTLSIGDYPGIIQPLYEVAKNEKFTGAPVVPDSMKGLPPEYQYYDRTPEIYRRLGKAMGISPLKAQHITRGYFRYLESYMSDATEAYFWQKDKWGERPFPTGPDDYLTWQFIGREVPSRTKYTIGYYELKRKAEAAKQAFSVLKNVPQRNLEAMGVFIDDETNTKLLAFDSAFSQIDNALRDSQDVLAAIKYDPKLSRKEKENRINAYYKMKNELLKNTYNTLEQGINEVNKQLAGNMYGQ